MSFRKKRLAALAFRRDCIRISSVSPLPSTARQSLLFPTDRDHNFVQVPFVGGLGAFTSDLGRNLCAKFRHPISDRLMTDRDAAFSQKILNVAQAEGETVVSPDGIRAAGSALAVPLRPCWGVGAILSVRAVTEAPATDERRLRPVRSEFAPAAKVRNDGPHCRIIYNGRSAGLGRERGEMQEIMHLP